MLHGRRLRWWGLEPPVRYQIIDGLAHPRTCPFPTPDGAFARCPGPCGRVWVPEPLIERPENRGDRYEAARDGGAGRYEPYLPALCRLAGSAFASPRRRRCGGRRRPGDLYSRRAL